MSHQEREGPREERGADDFQIEQIEDQFEKKDEEIKNMKKKMVSTDDIYL